MDPHRSSPDLGQLDRWGRRLLELADEERSCRQALADRGVVGDGPFPVIAGDDRELVRWKERLQAARRARQALTAEIARDRTTGGLRH